MNLLRRVFGPGRDEVWKQLSDEIGADFIKGGFFKGCKVQAKVKNWYITLDTYTVSNGKSSVTYTRMRAPFINRDGFRFTIYHKSLFSAVGKLLGMQDIEVGGPKFESLEPLFGLPSYVDHQIIESGEPEFDRDFIIKSNDEPKVRALFKQLKIRELIQSQPSIQLQVKGHSGKHQGDQNKRVDELYFQVIGVIKDVGRLKRLFELYEEVLEGLSALGSASEYQIPG